MVAETMWYVTVIIYYIPTLFSCSMMLWEHDVGGSNPSTPTNNIKNLRQGWCGLSWI
jgi:hypothetical protein